MPSTRLCINSQQPTTITLSNIEVYYNGDDIDEATSDGWLMKFYTDIEMDQMGNFVGPGSVMQLLLNVEYESAQKLVLLAQQFADGVNER